VQALGQSSADALPCLRRVLDSRSPLPESFFMAYDNLCDPRGLPDLLPAIRSSDSRSRLDALFAAAALLEQASKRSRRRPSGAPAFADAIAPLVEREDWNFRGPAIECLGWLRDPRLLGTLHALSTGSDTRTASYAIEAIARYRSIDARARLIELLAHADTERATMAATCLLDDRSATRAAKRRASAVAVRGLATLPGDRAWCTASHLCRTSLRLRRAVCKAIEAGRGREKKRLVQALICMVPPRPPWKEVFERRLLATCGPEIRPIVARALSARIAKIG
jgi:hypothetical protein